MPKDLCRTLPRASEPDRDRGNESGLRSTPRIWCSASRTGKLKALGCFVRCRGAGRGAGGGGQVAFNSVRTASIRLDHSDNHIRLGLVTDVYYDELDGGKPRSGADLKPVEALPKKCPQCTFLKPPKLLVCPSCGFKPEPQCTIVNGEGELVEFTHRATINAVAEARNKVRFFQELRGSTGAATTP
jgi:hypothetical protein